MDKLIQALQGASLAFFLGLAVTVVTLFTGQLAPGLYIDILKSRMTSEELAALSKSWGEKVAISEDGQLLIYRSHYNRSQPSIMASELFDMEHNPIQEPLASELSGRLLPYSVMGRINAKVLEYCLEKPIPLKMRVSRLDWNHEETEAWYFVYGGPKRGQGPGWLEGYDRRTHGLLGYLGTEGFTDHKPREAECFQVIAGLLEDGMNSAPHMMMFEEFSKYRNRHLDDRDNVASDSKLPIEEHQVLVLSGGRVWSVDLKERTVRFFSSDTNVQLMSIAQRLDPLPNDYRAEKPEAADDTVILSRFIALRLDDRIKFLNQKLGDPFEIPIPDEMRDRAFVYYLLRDGSMIAEPFLTFREHKTAAGTFKNDCKIIQLNRDNTQASWVTKTYRSARPKWISESTLWWISVWKVPAPLASLLIATFGHAAAQWPDFEHSFYHNMLEGFENAWPALVALCLFSSILVWLADRWLANHRLPRSHAWLAFVFLFGLPGAIGFLLHRKWPVKNPTPAPEKSGVEVLA